MPILDDKLYRLNQKCEANTGDITDTKVAVTETYEKILATDTTVTDIQLAMVELYEMMLGDN